MKDDTLVVIVVKPGKRPYKKEIPAGLQSLQREVGGNIEATMPFEDRVFLIADADAVAKGRERNRAIYGENGKINGIIHGTFLVAGVEGERFATLPDPLMDKYVIKFWTPDHFLCLGGKTGVFKFDDDLRGQFPSLRDVLESFKGNWKSKTEKMQMNGGMTNMTNEELNHALYEKMSAQQEKYRDWLLQQSPEEILNHAYEYTVREDIVNVASYIDLTDDEAQALLSSPTPLDDVYSVFDKSDITLNDTIRECFEDRAHTLIERQKEELRQTPVYLHSGTYAREHGELDAFRKSNRANEMCRDAIDKSISDHYDGSSLGVEAVREVVDKFGFDRTLSFWPTPSTTRIGICASPTTIISGRRHTRPLTSRTGLTPTGAFTLSAIPTPACWTFSHSLPVANFF